MLRATFISLSKARWAQRAATQWGWAWRIARRFVAGQTIEEGIETARRLNAKGIRVTLDHLGENTSDAEEAIQATNAITDVLEAIHAADVQANVSIKLSQIGLALDDELCRENLRCILDRAKALGNFVRIDMEDSSLTQATLNTYYAMREAGYENLGVVIQAYLYRSEDDIRKIVGMNGRVRLCKGAYREPAMVAFPRKRDVDDNYDRLARLLLEGAKNEEAPASMDGRFPPLAALATHDPLRIEKARAFAQQIGLPKGAYEFQMLYGIRSGMQEDLAREGEAMRVYVPFGTHWYPYFMRRLAERPANLWFIVKNLVRG